ncbi:hypothetical protein F9L06_03695 [Brucella anthropi]|uniref:Uncharacterized protein n=1 Tax=Brucella anthropi TaxID=529 RepID=A0A6I0DTT2_BRUAN|nr:hypothetical protein [Brucella anthropi]KAB2803271.1 hypothetical protein F9L06_03695 [Brucella anthropi]
MADFTKPWSFKMRRPFKLAMTFAIGSLLLTGSSAASQTASETVAFILLGLEDGRAIESNGDTVRLQQVGQGSTAKYRITVNGKKLPEQFVTISQVNDCQYAVQLSGDNIPNSSAVDLYDFGQLISAEKGDPFTTITFGGQCPIKYGVTGRCGNQHNQPLGYSVDGNRLKNAITYFKTTFCAGSAF